MSTSMPGGEDSREPIPGSAPTAASAPTDPALFQDRAFDNAPVSATEAANRAALESMPHLLGRVTELWASRGLNTLIHAVINDARNRRQRGLPLDIAEEVLFIAKINRQVRIQETAERLQVSIDEASEMIDRGDRFAATQVLSPADVWDRREGPRIRTAPRFRAPKPAAPPPVRPPAHPYPAAASDGEPPLPEAILVAVTGSGIGDDQQVMDWGFFRCIAKEIGSLGISRMILVDSALHRGCNWLARGILFARAQYGFSSVDLHTDLTLRHTRQLAEAMAAGLNRLVLRFDFSSGAVCGRLEALLAQKPDYFQNRLRRLLQVRDDLFQRTGHHCTIVVERIGRAPDCLLEGAFHQCASFLATAAGQRWEAPVGVRHAETPYRCPAAFTMGHIRSNGKLMACAVDDSPRAFVADLKDTKFAEGWSNPAFRKYRQRLLARGKHAGPHCHRCQHWTNH